MTCANVSVAIALAGGFAMLLAASGSPLNVHEQIQAIRLQLSGKSKGQNTKPAVLQMSTFQQVSAVPPPADQVSLAWSNGVPLTA